MEENERKIIEILHKFELYDLRLQIIDTKSQNAKDQAGHMSSMYDSEERNRIRQGEDMKEVQKKLEKHGITLYHNGEGIVLRVASLEQHRQANKTNLALVISLTGLALAIIAMILK